jgi:hypothetical protein
VLGIYTEINDESMMVMTPDSQILKDRAIHCGYYFFGFHSAVGHKKMGPGNAHGVVVVIKTPPKKKKKKRKVL